MYKEKINILKENICKRFTGKDSVVDNLIIALLAGGHVLIEDVPGVGKTTLAKSLAESVAADFARVQFTPDTLPTDILGTSVYSSKNENFHVVKGPVFHQFLLADEINRTSPKTQSALLEAMEERQVTIDGETFELPRPFMVLATQNPSEQIGTYPLPEAELDRFLMKISIGYPGKDMQNELAHRFLTGKFEEKMIPVLSVKEVLEMMDDVKKVIIKNELLEYALTIVEKTRSLKEVVYGLSPRAGLELLRASQACAYVRGRDFVIPEDIIDMAKVVFPHRLPLTTEARISRFTGYQLIIDVVEKVKRPK
ncbi:MAG: MoxR family ATPase [Lachnospiraceae bacterium]|nr:MoxR family ATPase [Lachnospiraceae bacterium]